MSFVPLHTFRVESPGLEGLREHLEPTNDPVWLSKTVRLWRHTLEGVPARLIDVQTPAAGRPHERLTALAVEIGRSCGRYDGAERWSVNVRPFDADQAAALPAGTLEVVPGNGRLVLLAVWGDGPEGTRPCWARAFPQLRSVVEGYDLGAIVMWHRERYYQMVPYEEARLLADSFGAQFRAQCPAGTLAEANRLASRELYALAVALGWRKLSREMKRRLGLPEDGPQWQRADTLPKRSPTGCGQHTLDAAAGKAIYPLVSDGDTLQTAYGAVEVE